MFATLVKFIAESLDLVLNVTFELPSSGEQSCIFGHRKPISAIVLVESIQWVAQALHPEVSFAKVGPPGTFLRVECIAFGVASFGAFVIDV